MPNFLFGGNTGTTYEQLQQRQAVANRLLAANARTPQNVGEGLNAVGRAIAERMMRRQNMTTESQLQSEFDAQMAALFGGGPGGGVGGGVGATASNRSFAPGSGGTNTAGAASAVSGNTNAPTAGLRHMLPDTDPDLMDPRRASFPTAAPRVDDPTEFTTDISGATDGVNPDLLRAVRNSVEQSYGPGASVNITSGRRHGHAGGSDHNSGEAADFNITDRFGVQSTSADPRVFDTARVAAGDGVRAVGIGPDYMGGNHFHFGTGEGQGIPNARTWSDWNTGAELARYGRNSAGAGGAGDPNFSFANEMQGIMDGRAVPTGTTGAATAVANPPAAPAPQGGGLVATASAQNAPQGQGALPPDIEALKAQASGGGIGSPLAIADPMARIAALTQLMNNPMASEGQRMVLGAMLQQGMRQAFPEPVSRMDEIELQLAELELERALSGDAVEPIVVNGQLVDPTTGEVIGDYRNPGGSNENLPSAVVEAQWRAEQAGLVPGTPEYQSFIINGGGDPATFRALDMQARAAGFAPGTPEYANFMATRGAGLQSNAAREGTLQADIELGGQANAVESAGAELGQATVQAGVEAWNNSRTLRSTLSTYDDAIAALDAGADSGLVYNRLPRVDLEGATLQNAMDRLGLDVVGSVTFGALSETELRLAMETAVPRNLNSADLRTWLENRRVALERSAAMLEDAAAFLTTPGNTIDQWIAQNRDGIGNQGNPAAPPNQGNPAAPPDEDRPAWSSLPEATRAGLREVHTPEELAAFFEDFSQ